MARVGGVIFDVDGTLVDSNDQHARSWMEALAEAGHPVPYEKIRPLIGMGGDKLLPRVAGLGEDTPEGQKISARRGEIFRTKYLPHLRAFPRSRELLLRLRREGLTLAVASSAKKEELQPLLSLAGGDGLFAEITSSGDADRSKPDPDIVKVALSGLDLPGDRVVMIGDTPYDIEAASRSGIRTVALRCGGWGDEELHGAVAVYDAPADLLAHLETSPLLAP